VGGGGAVNHKNLAQANADASESKKRMKAWQTSPVDSADNGAWADTDQRNDGVILEMAPRRVTQSK
jgi:hypothetical protein